MIILNTKKFAENEKEFVNSLFDTGGTCIGYAKRLSRQIKIENQNHKLIGVINKYGCLCKADKIHGRHWYSYGNIDLIGEYGCAAYDNDLQDIKTICRYNKEKEYWFK